MTRLFRSKSCGLVGLTEFNSVPPAQGPLFHNKQNKNEEEDEEEDDEYEVEDEYGSDVSVEPISRTRFKSRSLSPSSRRGADNNKGAGQQHQCHQFPILDILAAALRKSLVTCSVETSEDVSSMDISWPTQVRHVSHVTFDRFNGFLGLPTELEPELPWRVPSASASVFGVSAKSMQCSYDDRGNSVPTILLMMQKRLYSEGGLRAEGIFRITAENSQEEYVRDQLNRGVVLHGIDVHCLAGLIKAWLRELPTGVLDSLTPEQVMHCNTEDDCTQLVNLLPPMEGALLDWCVNLMADVVQHEQFNKMNARNIAMVFVEKQVKASSSKMLSYLNSVEALMKEIGGANEEQVLVELARIEALKEFGEIEAQRVKEAIEFSDAMEKTKQKMKDIFEEIDQSKELEAKLTSTMSDVHVLQKELKLVKEMKAKVQINDRLSRGSFQKGKELGTSPSLQSITEELEAAKKELAVVREEGFQFMTSMDVIRDELKHVTKETVQLKKTEEKTDLTVQNLNSKLLRAKSKLEVVSAAEEKAKSILSNLSLTLEQLKTEAEAAKKEKELNTAETATIKADIQKTESEIDLTEERLQAAMEKLEVVKSSESSALENLRTLIEKTMTARALATQHSSKITISKFEYEYLTGRAVQAEEIADKKVAAADAWTEALKASEKEILMKTELAQREIKEVRVEAEQESYRARGSLSAKRIVEGELQNRRQKREKNAEAENLQLALHRKSMKSNASFTPSRRAKFQKSASPAARKSASPGTRHLNLFTIKKKKKVMPNLAKLIIGKRNDKDLRAA